MGEEARAGNDIALAPAASRAFARESGVAQCFSSAFGFHVDRERVLGGRRGSGGGMRSWALGSLRAVRVVVGSRSLSRLSARVGFPSQPLLLCG